MTFSFNFALEDDSTTTTTTTSSISTTLSTPSIPSKRLRNGERFIYHPNATSMAFSPVHVGTQTFQIVNTTDANFVTRTGVISSILITSDVQTNVYEGGFKLWECALDLVKFVEMEDTPMATTVLELGCGHGLPGIHALLRGAERVTFSDYNKEVLELTTCPNVLRNVDKQLFKKADFYAGAWSSMSRYMEEVEQQTHEQMQFDLILTAETIYTEAVAVELYQTIKRHLRRASNARALVAAKKYYFGTNGSVQHFVGLVQADGVFRAETVWEERDGRSNIREIVQLTYLDAAL
ncbi:unnamed protein product [Peronospora farinosa]|uniref:protein-histidine N-methyltransferase n=1 Tax=Peronospora farinosa TaxID=134698 RepID=A0ABN8BZ05_9STRA|nr:unnamed protein product [Peronospora farinosa]